MLLQPDGSDEVRRLFHEQVPEVANGIIEIRAVARERGYRSIMAVRSLDPGIDPVGCCVGQRGSRVKSVVKNLFGEQISIVLWSDSPEELIRNTLAPILIRRIELDEPTHRAAASVDMERSGLRTIDPIKVRLVSKLTGWELQLIEI